MTLNKLDEYKTRLLQLISDWVSKSNVLTQDDVDDIWIQFVTKFYNTYLKPDSSSEYTYINDAAEWALIRQMTEQIVWRVAKARERELKLCLSLKEESNHQLGQTSIIQKSLEAEVITEIDFWSTLDEICDTPLKRQVMDYQIGLIERHELDISEEYLRVIKHRIKVELKSRLKD